MKNFAQHARDLSAVAALIVLGYGVVIKAGWVIGRAEADAMIQLAVQASQQTAAQAIYDEAKARERADLQLQQGLALERLKILLSTSNRTEVQNLEVELLKKEIDARSTRLSELNGP